MNSIMNFILLFCFFLLADNTVKSTRTEKKIYFSVENGPCFRRLNATHQIGCSSGYGGNVGVLQYLENEEDKEWVLKSGPHSPYAVLMDSTWFDPDLINELKKSGRVNGIMVIHVPKNSTETPLPAEGFSPDSKCPNGEHDMYSNNTIFKNCQEVKWNSKGTGLMFQDFGNFPIFAVTNATQIDFMIQRCYRHFNERSKGNEARDYPLCAVQMNSRMDAIKDAVTCMRRTNHQTNLNPDTFCQELGDRNVYGTMKTVLSSETRKPDSVILVATRLDSFTLFENISPSADNHVSGIVSLLATAKALAAVKDEIKKKNDAKDILFVFFQGEAFDYIGSSKVVYDMERNKFPSDETDMETVRLHNIDLHHISSIIELGQVGYTDDGSHWIHTDPLSRSDHYVAKEIDVIVQTLLNRSDEFHFNMNETDQHLPLPPASTHRFLMHRTIPAVVLTDHNMHFTNKFYNSRFDLPKNINISYPASLTPIEQYNYITEQAKLLSNFSTVVARTLYKLSTGEDSDKIEVDPLDVTHLLYCYLILPNCDLFHAVVQNDDGSKALNETKRPFDYYVTVYSTKDKYTNNISKFTKQLLAYFIGDAVKDMSEKNCSSPEVDEKMYNYFWMQGEVNPNDHKRHGVCIKASVDLTDSYSPAFIDTDNIDWSGKYSTWTESVWQADAIDLRIFLIPSKQFETAVLSGGVILLLVSFLIVWFLNANADVIFSQTGAPEFL